MNVLQLSPQVPYPLSDGGKVGIFNITKHLAKRGHRITMLAFEQESGQERKPLEEVCELITVPHSNKNSIVGAVRNLFSGMPYNSGKYVSKKYLETLRGLLDSRNFDVVHIDHLHMSPYGIFCKQHARLPIVLREHNVESVILERYAGTVRVPVFRQWLNMQVGRIRAFEGRMAGQFDACCVITEEDKKRLLELNPAVKMHVIPAGVEERYFLSSPVRKKLPRSIALVGNFEWLPNQDALAWFLADIFPRVRREQSDATLYVIGKNIPDKVRSMGNGAIVVRGFVPDFQQELQRYELTVVPLRVGGGMRLKILESFAIRIPVVTTSVGCEGILGKDGEHLLTADTEEQFVAQVVRALRDPNLRKVLAENAFQLVKQKYRWERIAEDFERTYTEVVRL